ncbi:MAG: FHA domain-containing protein [Vicinamibacteria bacterium]
MRVAAIEIHDAGVTCILEGSDTPVVVSPGYAVYESGKLLTGWTAARKARLVPRNCHTRFWDQLDGAPLPPPFPAGIRSADLAHAHLSSVWEAAAEKADRAILLVPSWYSDNELGLLLGISRACRIPVTGMVDSTLAAGLGLEGDSAIHLDLHLHRAVAALVTRGTRYRRDTVRSDEGAGLLSLQNHWASFLAEKFVRETRFDPLHEASTEQRLYDRMPDLLEALRERETESLVFELGSKEHGIEVSRGELARAALPFYRRILEVARSLVGSAASGPRTEPRLRISSRIAALPGIAEMLAREISFELVPLPPGIATQNVLAHRHRLPHAGKNDGAIPFVTSLPLDDAGDDPGAASPAPEAMRERTERIPTHVLWDGVAHPIDPGPFHLGVDIPEGARGVNVSGPVAGISRRHCTIVRIDGRVAVEDHSRYGSYVNGKRVEERAFLRAGDRLRLGTPGVEVQLIEVKS